MIPESSDLYTYSLETTQASFPRYPSSLATDTAPDALQVCYRRYKASTRAPPKTKTFNMVFLHGTGMNKGVFHYHIDQLYQKCPNLGVHVNLVLAVDTVNHGSSAVLNSGKLGNNLDWRDVSYDVAKVAEAEKLDLLAGDKNLLIGHSMAGSVSLYLSFLRPGLFDSVVLLNPVGYQPSTLKGPPTEPFLTWKRKGYIETQFQVEHNADWKQYVRDYMNTKSFYRNFDPSVLENMLEDEYPMTVTEDSDRIMVKLNTTQKQTLITYFGSTMFLKKINPVFPLIEIPVYRILGELDITLPETRAKLAAAIPKMKTIILPGKKHLLHGTEPDLFVDTLLRIIKERKNSAPTQFTCLYSDLKL